jgi:hypothetical protein
MRKVFFSMLIFSMGYLVADFRKGTFQWGKKLAKLENKAGWTIKGNFPEY